LFEIWQKRYYNWFQTSNFLDAAFSTACLFTTCLFFQPDWKKVGYMPHILATSYVVWRKIGQMLYFLTTLYGHWRRIGHSPWTVYCRSVIFYKHEIFYIVAHLWQDIQVSTLFFYWIMLCFNMSIVEKRVFMFVLLLLGIMLIMVVVMQLLFMYVEYVKSMWLNYNIAW
jgi:hypothetical protein